MNENQINKQRSGKYLTAFLCCAFLSINSLAINPAYIYGAGLLSIIKPKQQGILKLQITSHPSCFFTRWLLALE